MPPTGKTLYLTFDDGPHPDITPRVLAILAEYNAKATFFCIGDRVQRYPEVFQKILDAGHFVGNHTQHHLRGTKTSLESYLADVQEASGYIASNLFRPPYGRITRVQEKALLAKGYQVVMWTMLSADYDVRLTDSQVIARATTHLEDGFIYLFHDSEKAEERMFPALRALLALGKEKGFQFEGMR